jgi:arylsulfatase
VKTKKTMTPPNILWICTDQQRFDTIHALGNEHIHTPNLDRLVAEGAAFTHAYCQSPICTPSRASFLTGMYPSRVQACCNGNDVWAGAAPLVTKLLSEAGYDCGLSGKLHLAAAENRIEKRGDDGYRVFHWSHGPIHLDHPGHEYDVWLTKQGYSLAELRKDPAGIPPELHQTTWCADRAIDFIEAAGDQPWLFSVNIFDPHAPFDPPQSYSDRYPVDAMPGPYFQESDLAVQEKLSGGIDYFQNKPRHPESFNARGLQAAYWAMVELIDENVGRMLDALERTGQAGNTLVIFTSDHGETLGDHGLLMKGCRFYEGLVRVPLLLRLPGQIPAGLRSETLVELTDIAPTLLELAGLSVPVEMQGRSLLPILKGGALPVQHRDFVRCEYYAALPMGKHPQPNTGTRATMIRNRRYKLTIYHGTGLGELFDLQQDPWEFDNLWDDPGCAEVRFELTRQSFDALAAALDLGPAITGGY